MRAFGELNARNASDAVPSTSLVEMGKVKERDEADRSEVGPLQLKKALLVLLQMMMMVMVMVVTVVMMVWLCTRPSAESSRIELSLADTVIKRAGGYQRRSDLSPTPPA